MSLILAAFTLVGLVAVGALYDAAVPSSWWRLTIEIGSWLANPNDYVASDWLSIFVALTLYLAVSLSAAWLASRVLFAESPHLLNQSSWTQAFRSRVPEGCIAVARVRMEDGTIFVGKVGHFSADFDVNARELALHAPLYVRKAGGTETRDVSGYASILLHSRDIRAVMVQYRNEP